MQSVTQCRLGTGAKARLGSRRDNMANGDILRATIEGTFDGEPVVIGLGFVSNSGAGSWDEEVVTLTNELRDALTISSTGGAFLAPLSIHYTVDRVRIQDLNPGVSASFVSQVGFAGGNTVDDALPPNDALCVTWRTGLKGKENRGRSYLTGFAEDSQVSGFWIPEIQDWASGAFADALLSEFGPLGAGNYALSLIHTQSGGVRLIPPTATPITSFTINNQVRSLRRRAVGVRISRRRPGP
jgi:hypothetical protein